MRLKRGRKAYCQLGTSAPERRVGYCHLHKVNMTVRQMRNRQCRQKGCRHFVPCKQHDYWRSHGPKAWREITEQKEESEA